MSKLTKAERDRLTARSGGICELCGVDPATNWHHRKNRSQGGKNNLGNALHLCGSGTTGCHGWVTENPAKAYEMGWSVRSGFNPADVPVYRRQEWAILTEDGFMFLPPNGKDRCVRCGFHEPTQGHRPGCPFTIKEGK